MEAGPTWTVEAPDQVAILVTDREEEFGVLLLLFSSLLSLVDLLERTLTHSLNLVQGLLWSLL